MNDHFKGNYEVELKFRLTDTAALLQKLTAQHAESFVTDNREQDIYFELEGNQLGLRNLSMLVRRMTPSGIKLWIIKGPGADRCEAVKIESITKTQSMLHTLGYRPAFELLKTRSIYFLAHFHITVDHINGLGDFAEIAVMTDERSQLDRIRRQCLECADRLGLTAADIEPRSYRQLLGH